LGTAGGSLGIRGAHFGIHCPKALYIFWKFMKKEKLLLIVMFLEFTVIDKTKTLLEMGVRRNAVLQNHNFP